jgi:Tfp pilus assembly protein PilO
MNKLSKEKKDKLLLTCIACVGGIAVLYFLVITDQKAELTELSGKITALRSKRDTAERLTKRLSDVQANLEAQKKILAEKQAEMPRENEDHVWFLRIMEEMRPKYGLEVDDIKNPEAVEAGVLPKFPFRAVSLNVSMLGDYSNFGSFLADFENRYPYMRVQLMSVSAATGTGRESARSRSAPSAPRESGKLRFNYRVIALIKSPI